MYEYTDDDNDGLHVESSIVFGQTYVGTVQDNGPATGVLIHTEDAPAIALAILEAAGIKPAWDEQAQGNPERWASKAVEALTYSVKHRAEIAEREAEDAKVDNWRTFNRLRGQVEVAWKCLSEYERNEWRTNYNAARKFFEES